MTVKPSTSSRRNFVGQILGMLGCLPFAPFAFAQAKQAAAPAKLGPFSISVEDDKFLHDLEKATFQYFWEQANPKTGLVKDRCNTRVVDKGTVGSIAATGFGLTALCIGERRGFITRAAAQQRALATMMCLWGKLPHHRGFFYTGPTLIRGSAFGTRKSLLSTPQFCCAECWLAGNTSLLRKFRRWRMRCLIGWSGRGCRRIPPCCHMDGRRSWASCPIVGTTTPN